MSIHLLLLFLFLTHSVPGHEPVETGESNYRLYVSNYEHVLGTSFEMKVWAASESIADEAEVVALNEVDRLSAILSGYDSASEFNRWQASLDQPVQVSSELYEVLAYFDAWQLKSGGGINPSAEAINRLWKEASRHNVLPGGTVIDSILRLVNLKHWELDAAQHTATHLSAVPLMTNTFVKSYIIRKAVEKVRALSGIQSVVINIGGDLIVSGEVEEKVWISNPLNDGENELPVAVIQVKNRAVATSGNYRRGIWVNGKRYSHIVDPRSGFPVDHVISATVVASDAVAAGAMATAFNVLSVAEGIRLAESIPGLDYLVIASTRESFSSGGWKS
jgi:thiamine biosynthesis lipoprotein ApbE